MQEPLADHTYNERAEMSFADFVYEQDEVNFQVNNHLKNLKPTSADIERMFSLGRLSKNILPESNVQRKSFQRCIFRKKINFV